MSRHTRYQGLILQDHHVLLIQTTLRDSGMSFWLLPGGGLEPGETPEECVVRELKEETGLDVKVDRLIYRGPVPKPDPYQELETYLCRPVGGKLAPGHEPEAPFAAITAVRWVDLRDQDTWGEDIYLDEYTYPQLDQLRQLLGYNT